MGISQSLHSQAAPRRCEDVIPQLLDRLRPSGLPERHWPEPRTLRAGGLEPNAHEKPLLAVALNRNPALTAKLIGVRVVTEQKVGFSAVQGARTA
jgi:hypothetical protein